MPKSTKSRYHPVTTGLTYRRRSYVRLSGRRSPTILAFLYLLIFAGTISAQPAVAPAGPSAAQSGSELTISLVTMGPGEEVYEKFGHNAIMIEDRSRGTRTAFNYGVFDFDSGFIPRFIEGKMWYRVEAPDFDDVVGFYKYTLDRSIWVQRLDLTPRQRLALRDFLVWNCFGKNADGSPAQYYQYDYYRDNCSTRARDALDRALGGQLKAKLASIDSGTTYRWHTRRITGYNFPLYTALDFILGQNVDRPLSEWDECFLPLKLRDYLAQVTVLDESGRAHPLVASDQTLYQSTRWTVSKSPPFWLPWYLAIGAAVAGGLAGLPRYAERRRIARVGWSVLCIVWAFLLGGAGTFLAWGTMFTSHWSIYRNENLFHFSPLALPLMVLAPALMLKKRWAVRPATWLATAVAASSVVGLLIKALPWFRQVNFDMIAMTLPANLALLWAILALAKALPAAAPARAPAAGSAKRAGTNGRPAKAPKASARS